MAAEGVVLGGRFRTLRKLGEGGQAGVWLADDLHAGGVAAVKILPVPGEGETESARRFRREYELCADFSHPNVVRFLGAGSTEEGGAFYAMEFLDCPSLDRVIAERGPLAPDRVRDLGRQMAAGLAHVHAKGVLHRDLKPANVMMTQEGRVVLVDFGLARDDNRTRLTATGMLLGTPYYMAPETILGDEVDARSDLFGVGAVLFEALTGERAFEAPDLVAVTRKIVAGEHGTPKLWQDAPEDLVVVVERLLSVDPEDRYPTAVALEAALAPAQSSAQATPKGSRGSRSRALRGTSSAGLKRTGAHSSVTSRPQQRRLLPVLFFLAVVGAGLAVLGRWQGEGGPAPSAVLGSVAVGSDWVSASWILEGGGTAALVVQEEGGTVVRGLPIEGGAGSSAVVGLRPDRSLRVWVEGSTGVRSLPQTVRTSSAEAVVRVEGGAAFLAWNEPGPWRATLTALEAGGRRSLGELHGEGPGRWQPVPGQVGPDTEDVEVAVTSSHRALPRTFSLAPALSRVAAEVGAGLRRIEPEHVLNELAATVDSISDRDVDQLMGSLGDGSRPKTPSLRAAQDAKRALLKARAREHLDELGIPVEVARLRVLGPLLGAGRLLPWPVLRRFMGDVSTLLELRLRSAFLEADWDLFEPFPELPCLRCTTAAGVRADEVHRLLPPSATLVLGLENPFFPESVGSLERVVELRDVAGIRSAELRLRTSKFRYLTLSLYVGDVFISHVYREPIFRLDYAGAGTTWQRIPVGALSEGPNRLRLVVEPRLLRNPRHQVVVEEAVLVIERRR